VTAYRMALAVGLMRDIELFPSKNFSGVC
jgi:hypothetical protein